MFSTSIRELDVWKGEGTGIDIRSCAAEGFYKSWNAKLCRWTSIFDDF